jgi:hypothetical protein
LPDRGVFHVTARGVNRSVIAFDDIDHNALQQLVQKTAADSGGHTTSSAS